MGMQMQESVNKDLIIEGLVVKRNTRGRAIYNKQAVSQLVARCKEPGVSIAHAAMVNGVNANRLAIGQRRCNSVDARTVIDVA